jgi:hypothetical protein
LLAYTLGTVPDPLQAGGEAMLELTVQNASQSARVTVLELDVTLPLGTDATSLCESSIGITAVKPDDTWTLDWVKGSPVFKFCAPSGGVVMKGQPISLRLLNIAVNDTPGTTAPVQVTATTGDPKDPVTEPFSATLQKFPAQFSLGDLTQDSTTPSPVPWGGEVTLKWTGTADPAYPPVCTLTRSDSGGGAAWPQDVGVLGSCDVTNLTPDGEFVVFQLTATMAVTGQTEPLVCQKQHTVQVEAPAPKIDTFNASVDVGHTPPQLTVTWSASHTGSVGFLELGLDGLHDEGTKTVSVTADAPLPTTLTMCAYPPTGRRTSMTAVAPDSRTLRTTWGVQATNPTAADPESSIFQLVVAEDSLLAAQDGDNAWNVLVLNPWSLAVQTSLPSPPSPDSVAASADGKRIYVSDSSDAGTTQIYVFDATQSPPAKVGSPVDTGRDESTQLVFVPDGITSYGPTLLVAGGGGTVTPYPAATDPLGGQGQDIAFPTDSAALSADGGTLFGLGLSNQSGAGDGRASSMQALDLRTMTPGSTATLQATVTRLAPAPAGSVVAYSAGDLTGIPAAAHRFDADPPFALRASASGVPSFVNAAVQSPDGRSVYADWASGAIAVLAADTLATVSTLASGLDEVRQMAMSPDGVRLYVADERNAVALLTPSGYA